MKVLLANKYFYPKGGSETVFFQERKFLLEEGVNVIDFSMDDPRNITSPYFSYFVSNIDYYKMNGLIKKVKNGIKFIHSTQAVNNIKRLIQANTPDIAHLHNIYHQITPSIISVLKKKGIKIVMTLHDGKLICPNYIMLDKGKICVDCAGKYYWKTIQNDCRGSRSEEFLLMIEAFYHSLKGSYELVDCFISPSKFMADLIGGHLKTEKIKTLPNGIDVNGFTPQYSDENYGLYFGRLSREKGIETLLKAVKKIKNGMDLFVVGSGPDKDKLQSLYPEFKFIGFRKGKELRDLIGRSSFVIVPSEWYENCSMSVLEAMSMGKPVIGSRIGGIPEQIDDGITGYLFEAGNVDDLAEKIMKMKENSERRKKMGIESRKKIEREYSLDIHCKGLINIYENLLSKN